MSRLIIFISLTIMVLTSIVGALPVLQAQEPVPTLVPPTPIPRAESGISETLPTASAVARMQAEGVVRVGMLFNAPRSRN